MPEPLLGREEMLEALRRVGQRLQAQGQVADLFVFGGAAMVVAYQARPSTRDVDAVFEPDTAVREAALEVAREMGLPRHWLNNQASSYLSREDDAAPRLVLEAPGIRCLAASPEYILAMKLLSVRAQQDTPDIRFLIDHLGIGDLGQALAVLHRYYPVKELSERGRLLLEDILEERSQTEGAEDRADPSV